MTSEISNTVGCARQRSFSLQPSSTPICQQLPYNGYVAFPFFTLVSSKRYAQVQLPHLGSRPAGNYRARMNHKDKGEYQGE